VKHRRPILVLIVAGVLASASLGPSIAAASMQPSGAASATSTLTISTNGRIGALKLGGSTLTDVVAALGVPQAEAEGNFGDAGAPNYKGLGYECAPQPGGELRSVGSEGPPYCHTVYYLDTATRVLGGFWTISTRYATSHGTRVGISEHSAASREHRPATVGCLSGISELSRDTFLYISIRGGKVRRPSSKNQLDLVGGRVDNIAVESRHDPVGVLFC